MIPPPVFQHTYLLTPGPTPVPDTILSELGKPLIHHRTPQYRQIFREVSQGLKTVFQTKNDILTLTSSGTGAMEAAVVAVANPQDEVIVIRGGKFGERWGEIAEAYGMRVIAIDVPWGEGVRPQQVQQALKQHPRAAAVFATLCETSTGVTHDIKAVAALTRASQSLLVVDAISGLGADELRQDDWGVDVVVGGSQKALMLPPGLSFVSASERTWKRMEQTKTPRFYFDLLSYQKSLADDDVPYTPAISLVIGLKEALRLIQEEGMEKILQRHEKLAAATRAGAKGLGLELFAKTPCNVLTAIKIPQGVNGEKIVSYLRDEKGVTIAGGQAEMKGKIWRIAHLGAISQFDILVAFSALELALKKFGYPVKLGSGVAAAEEVFS
jgi:aspartate aminotransferase-like enzyme